MVPPNMDVIRPTFAKNETKSHPLIAALQASASPTAVLPLIQGEWLSEANDVWQRPGTVAGAEITIPTWPHWNQQGATTVQASLVTSCLCPTYEAWTLVWDALVAPPLAYGNQLAVAVAAGGTYTGYAQLLRLTGAGYPIGFVIGIVPTATGQRLNFRTNY